MTHFIPNELDPFLKLEVIDQVVLLTMLTKENRFSATTIGYLNDALDWVEALLQSDLPPNALITTSTGNIYSNGLDLEALLALPPISPPNEDTLSIPTFFTSHLNPLYERWLTFPILTVACLNGHCFAGGCIFAFCHDVRTMRNDRGYLCLNEVELPAPLQPGMAAILTAKMANSAIIREMVLKAKRFTAEDALKAGIIDSAAPPNALLDQTLSLAKNWPRIKSPKVFHLLKKGIYSEAVNKLQSLELYDSLVGFKPTSKL